MPTYDYRCPKCDKFSVYQGIREPKLQVCPTCGSPVSRLIGKNVNIIYKCQGFYSTDTRSPSGTVGKDEKPAEVTADQKPVSAAAENKTEGKAETKPADSKPEQKAVNQ